MLPSIVMHLTFCATKDLVANDLYSREKFKDCVGDDVGTGAGNILVQSLAGLSGTGDSYQQVRLESHS